MTQWIDNFGSCPNFLPDHSTTSVPAPHFLTDHSTISFQPFIFNQSFDNVGSSLSFFNLSFDNIGSSPSFLTNHLTMSVPCCHVYMFSIDCVVLLPREGGGAGASPFTALPRPRATSPPPPANLCRLHSDIYLYLNRLVNQRQFF